MSRRTSQGMPWQPDSHGQGTGTKSRLKQKFRQLTDDGLFYQEGKEDEVLTLLQKKLGMTREEIESILI